MRWLLAFTEPGTLDSGPETLQNEILETDSFAEVVYECPRVSSIKKTSEEQYSVTLNGELALHGVTCRQPVSARVMLKADILRAAGELSVCLSGYEIKPVTAAGGAIKLKDGLKLSFDLAARKTNG